MGILYKIMEEDITLKNLKEVVEEASGNYGDRTQIY